MPILITSAFATFSCDIYFDYFIASEHNQPGFSELKTERCFCENASAQKWKHFTFGNVIFHISKIKDKRAALKW